jgi:hypothetical protein
MMSNRRFARYSTSAPSPDPTTITLPVPVSQWSEAGLRESTLGRLPTLSDFSWGCSLRPRGPGDGSDIVSGVMALAVRHGAVLANPTRELERLTSARPRRVTRALSKEERARWSGLWWLIRSHDARRFDQQVSPQQRVSGSTRSVESNRTHCSRLGAGPKSDRRWALTAADYPTVSAADSAGAFPWLPCVYKGVGNLWAGDKRNDVRRCLPWSESWRGCKTTEVVDSRVS